MADDIAVFGLALDSSGMVEGQRRASQSLEQIAKSADRTTASVSLTGAQLDKLMKRGGMSPTSLAALEQFRAATQAVAQPLAAVTTAEDKFTAAAERAQATLQRQGMQMARLREEANRMNAAFDRQRPIATAGPVQLGPSLPAGFGRAVRPVVDWNAYLPTPQQTQELERMSPRFRTAANSAAMLAQAAATGTGSIAGMASAAGNLAMQLAYVATSARIAAAASGIGAVIAVATVAYGIFTHFRDRAKQGAERIRELNAELGVMGARLAGDEFGAKRLQIVAATDREIANIQAGKLAQSDKNALIDLEIQRRERALEIAQREHTESRRALTVQADALIAQRGTELVLLEAAAKRTDEYSVQLQTIRRQAIAREAEVQQMFRVRDALGNELAITREQAEQREILLAQSDALYNAAVRRLRVERDLANETERMKTAQAGATALAERNAAIIARRSAAVIAKAERDPLIEPFLEAARSMQRAFEDAFRNIIRNGKNIFEQFADTIIDIFIGMAASIAAILTAKALGIDRLIKMIREAADAQKGIGIGDVRKALGTAGQYAGGALAGGAIGYGVGYGTGSAVGGAVSGGLSGAAAGFALGGPPGAIIGAVVGIAAGIFGASQKIKEARKAFDEGLRGFTDKWSESQSSFTQQARALEKDFRDLEAAAYKARTAVNAQTRALYEAAQQRIRSDFVRSLDEQLNAVAGNDYANQVAAVTRAYEENLRTVQQLKLGTEAADKATRLYTAALDALAKAQAEALAALEAGVVDRLMGRAGLTRLVEDRGLARQQREEIEQARRLGGDPKYMHDLNLAHRFEVQMLEVTRRSEDTIRTLQEQLHVQEEAIRVAEQQVDATRQVVASLRGFRDSLLVGPLSALSPVDQLAEARRQLEQAYGAARGGDVTAAGRVPDLGRQFLELSRDYYGGATPGYAQAFETVRTFADTLEGQYGAQLTAQEQALKAAQDQVAVTKLLLETVHTDLVEQLRVLYASYELLRGPGTNWRDPSSTQPSDPTGGVPAARPSFSGALGGAASPGGGSAEIVTELRTANEELRSAVRILMAGFTEMSERMTAQEKAQARIGHEVALARERFGVLR
jgi:gas vesicle protein